VALQGTIETFALPDVLRLLASTKKTGCLRLEGSRGDGSLWVEGGSLVGSEASGAPHADGPGEVLFELLRFKDGDFVFDADADVLVQHSPADVEPTLEQAESMLEEWREIEAVVPTLDHWVSLAAELPQPEVTVTAEVWKTLVAVSAGTSVGALGDDLSLGELPVSRTVKELAGLGLVEVGDPRDDVPAPAPLAEPPAAEPAFGSDFASDPVSAEPAASDAFGAGSVGSDSSFGAVAEAEVPGFTAADADAPVFDPNALVIEDGGPGANPFDAPPPIDVVGPGGAAIGAPSDSSDAAEIARQLANLSPKAAKAVAAAAKATTQEEREAALAEVDDQEDPINRDLLIKFLGSVSS
jgi:hypothetical protein